MVHLAREELAAAARHLLRFLDICQQLQDTLGQAYALENLGGLRLRQREFDRASALLECSHRLFQQVGVLRGQGLVLRTMGELHAAQNREAEALDCFRRSVDIWRHLDVPTELRRSERCLDDLGVGGQAWSGRRA